VKGILPTVRESHARLDWWILTRSYHLFSFFPNAGEIDLAWLVYAIRIKKNVGLLLLFETKGNRSNFCCLYFCATNDDCSDVPNHFPNESKIR